MLNWRVLAPAFVLGAFVVLASCKSDPTAVEPVPTTITIVPAVAAFDALGATQSFQAIVKDQNGAIMDGQIIQWRVIHGSIASASTDGIVTPIANGATQLVASVDTVETSIPLTVQQRAQTIVKLGGDNQTAAPLLALLNPLRVSVRDPRNNPIVGAQVQFEVSPNGGTLSATNVTTAAGGEASTEWTMPSTPFTTQTVTARVNGTPTVETVFSATTSNVIPANSTFNIDLRFLTALTTTQRAAFTNAAAKWQAIISGDIPSGQLNVGAGDCGSSSPAFNETVDDVVIFALVQPIDDVGKILGQAGPCRIRNGSFLPISGVMNFDIADIANLEANGTLEAVILHEMGHVLGIGTIWPLKGLLVNPSLPSNPGVDTFFSGTNAIEAFNSIGGANYSGQKVPVENTQGDAGTRDSHWRESVFANELMTGFINNGLNPLSIVTARSLQDLGYVINPAAADIYVLPGLGAAADPLPTVHLFNDILRIPIRIGGR